MSRYEAGYMGHDAMREKAEREFRRHMDSDSDPENMITKHVGRIESYKKGGHVKHHAHHEHNSHNKVHEYAHSKHHGLNRDQKDLRLPHHPKRVARMSEGGKSMAMKHGGHAHYKHMNYGGEFMENVKNLASTPGLRRGGQAHHAHKKHPTHRKHMNEGGMLDQGQIPMAARQMPFQSPPGMPVAAMKRGGHAHKKHPKSHPEHEIHHSRHKAHHYAEGAYAHGGDVYEREMVGEHPTHHLHHYDYESEMRGIPKSMDHKPMRHGGHARKMAMGGVGKYRHEEADYNGNQLGRKKDWTK